MGSRPMATVLIALGGTKKRAMRYNLVPRKHTRPEDSGNRYHRL